MAKILIKTVIFMLIINKSFANHCIQRDYKEFNGNFYILTEETYTWDDARVKAAKEYKGQLAVPKNKAENNWLANTFGLAWIGVHDPYYSQIFCIVNEDRFRDIHNRRLSFSNWYKDPQNPSKSQPNNYIYKEDRSEDGKVKNVNILGEHWAYISKNGTWGAMGEHAGDMSSPPRLRAIINAGKVKPNCYEANNPNLTINTDIVPRICSSNIRNSGSISNGTYNNNLGQTNQEFIRGKDIKDCLEDSNDIEYCPTNLKQCKESYEYDDGEENYENGKYTYTCKNDKNVQKFNWQIDEKKVTSDSNTTASSNSRISEICKRKQYICQFAKERYCAKESENSYVCSPHPCFGEAQAEKEIEINQDISDNGFSEKGECLGAIYIFNGSDKRCRYKDLVFGLAGGGCCKKDKPKSLGKLFGQICKEDEKLLVAARKNKENDDRTFEVGTYCSKKIKLGFIKICIQWKKTFCVFSSELARIIHEQGREQLESFSKPLFGTPTSPQCRGFTPEEFQKLDFSKIDLSEYSDKKFSPDKMQGYKGNISNILKKTNKPNLNSEKQKKKMQ